MCHWHIRVTGDKNPPYESNMSCGFFSSHGEENVQLGSSREPRSGGQPPFRGPWEAPEFTQSTLTISIIHM
jgi:hypothetical protein